jgi:hypothetical protein
MEFTQEQLEIINSDKPEILFDLEGIEVLAIYSLGQMNNKIVRSTSVYGTTTVGLFVIESFNGKSDLDFSNPDDWRTVHLEEIFFSITSPNGYGGYDKVTTNNLFDIQSIALLSV